MKKVFLGIDPGFSVTGFAILATDAGRTYLLDYGYLQMTPKNTLPERVGIFHDFMVAKIKTHGVTQIALETSFLGKNPQTFLKLGYLRGILYLLANQNGIELFEFAPTAVKRSVTGSGSATKDQVATAIMRMFPKLSEMKKIAKDDVTDALAISLCGLWQSKQHALLR